MSGLDKSFDKAMKAAAGKRGPGKTVTGFMGVTGRLTKPGGWPPTGWVRVSETEKDTGHVPGDKAVGAILERKGRFASGVAIYPYPDPKDQAWRGQEFATREAAEAHVKALLAKVPPRTARKKTAVDRAFDRKMKAGYYIVETVGDAFDQPTEKSAIASARKLFKQGQDPIRVVYSPSHENEEELPKGQKGYRYVFQISSDAEGKPHETTDEQEMMRTEAANHFIPYKSW